MAEKQYSNHQKDLIKCYYQNIDTISLQKLQELVTEIYLAQTPARKKRLWENARKAMIKLKIKPAIINHIIAKRSPQILAKHLQDWLKKPVNNKS